MTNKTLYSLNPALSSNHSPHLRWSDHCRTAADQLGALAASSITYIEAVLGEHFTYAQAMGLLAATVLLIDALVIALGPEAKGVSFRKGIG